MKLGINVKHKVKHFQLELWESVAKISYPNSQTRIYLRTDLSSQGDPVKFSGILFPPRAAEMTLTLIGENCGDTGRARERAAPVLGPFSRVFHLARFADGEKGQDGKVSSPH